VPAGFKLDLHNHTNYSSDGVLPPAALLNMAKQRGLDCLAITDHDSVRGALEAASLALADPTLPRVIPGVELTTRVGEIIGLYVSEDIPKRLPLNEAVTRIREQGGLVYLPHPFDYLRRGTISPRERLRAAQWADIIEVVNGRSLGPGPAKKAAALAEKLGKPAGAGSDAHWPSEVGTVYVVTAALPTVETLVDLLAAGHVQGGMRSRQYVLNWGLKSLAPVTRLRSRLPS
jgi:predicted metal-dependent phosphoesterase TrpH